MADFLFVCLGEPFLYQRNDGVYGLFRVFFLHEKEICLFSVGDVRKDTLVDPVGIHDDA